MKKVLSVLLAVIFLASLIGGCGNVRLAENEITVVSREDGSGTRGAFVELFGLLETGADGTRKDTTYKEAIIANRTDVMMTTVANDANAIGYISLGSLNDTVKAVNIGGIKASAANVKNGTYEVSRPFIIAVKGTATGLQKDFIDYILSAEGQAVVNERNYIAIDPDTPAYAGDSPAGKLTIAGSSSVSPLMEVLVERYNIINPNADIEIQTTDSSAGMTAAINGTCEIGMSSRELKDSEKEVLKGMTIAIDGIAVIVNNTNPHGNLSKAQVKEIFTGKILRWNELVN